MSQQKSFSTDDSENQQKKTLTVETAAQIASDSLQSGPFGVQLPPEFDPSGSTLEGLRVLQCIEWLRDRILDGGLGHENAEMVPMPTPCWANRAYELFCFDILFIDISTCHISDLFLTISIRFLSLHLYLLHAPGRTMIFDVKQFDFSRATEQLG